MNSPQVDLEVSTLKLNRVVIEGMQPQIDGGRFAIKRIVGERVTVEADLFADGHEVLSAVVLYRAASESDWREAPMRFIENDRWQGEFQAASLGRYVYSARAWVDSFQTWSRDFLKKYDAGQDVSVDLLVGRGDHTIGGRTRPRGRCEEAVRFCRPIAAAFRLEEWAAHRCDPQR